MLSEFQVGGTWPTRDKRVLRQLDEYRADGEESAEAFDMADALPRLWAALWSLKGWSQLKRLMAWSMFLVACCIMARSSCMTTHCPTLERVRLPAQRHWDKDGMPKYIILVMLNWKSRRKESRGKPYPLKIHRNRLDPTYCPVTWLMTYWHLAGITEGAIFQQNGEAVKDDAWCSMTNHWFVQAGLRRKGTRGDPETGAGATKPSGCSNHSIRRSSAQWAGRCGAREMDVRNAGRWLSMQILAKYMAQGAVQREEYEDDEDGPQEDPIFKMFVFKKTTSAASAGRDII